MNDPGLVPGLLTFLLLAGCGSLAFAPQSHRQAMDFQAKLFLWAFTIRFALAVGIYQLGLVHVLGDEDASGWLGGVSLQRSWESQGVGLFGLPSVWADAFTSTRTHHPGYQYLLATFFYTTGTTARLPAAALNCFFGAVTVVFTYRIAQSLFSQGVAERAGWWSCFFPSLLVWSAQTVKEPVIILFETLALYGCIHLKRSGFAPRYIVLCALTVLALIPFRFYAAYITAAVIGLTLFLPRFSRGQTSVSSALAVAAIVVPILVLTGMLARHEAQVEQFDLMRIEFLREAVATGHGSGVVADYDLHTPTGFGVAVAVGAAHLLLAPFPWQLGEASLRMLLTLPELAVWWWLFFASVVPGLRYALRHHFDDIQPLLYLILGLGFLYSLLFGNIGLIYRQRAQLLPWLLIFAAVGLEQRALRRQARQPGWTLGRVPARLQW